MKVFIVVCLALAAVAEPDAQVLLNSPFYSSLAYNTPLAYNAPAMVYNTPLTYAVKPVEIKKEEEEKKEEKVVVVEKKVEEVKPVVYSTQPMVYNTVPLTYNTVPVAYNTPAMVYKTAVVPKYVAKNGEVEHIVAKREAEADPALFYSNAFGYNYAPYTTYAAPAMTYATPAMYYNTPSMVYNTAPVVYKTEDVKAKTYANDFNPFTAPYAAKGMYVADSVGARHVAKREAESQYLSYSTPYTTTYGSYYPYTSSFYSSPYTYSSYRYF